MKNKTAGAAYKAARGNLLAMLVLTAVNTLLALTGSDRYYLFTDFAAYIWAVFARGFYDFTGEAKWLVLGAAGAVLERMQKGHTAAAIVAAGQKARRAGLALSVTAISGLGSRELLREHAVDTARALSAMNPEYIGLLTLMVEPGTPLERWVREGSFQVLGPAEILQETALLLDHMDSPGSVFRMNHASNYLTLKGTLNRDLPALRQQVQEGLMGHGLRPESWRAL